MEIDFWQCYWFYEIGERERKRGGGVNLSLFPLWQKLWTFGDNHS